MGRLWAENENGQEKTEEPTAKRLEKSRDDGQVARSRELTTTFVLLGGVVGIMIVGGDIGQALMGLMEYNFSISRDVAFDEGQMIARLGNTLMAALSALIPLFTVLVVAAFVGPIALGGWLFSPKAMAPKFSKMSLPKGLKRMFSANALVELTKALAKFFLVAGVAIAILWHFKNSLVGLAQSPLETAIADMMTILGWSILAVSSPMLIVSAIDVPFQIFDHKKKLRMTRQEVKDEVKDSEGKPEVKSRVRQLQYEMAQRRMMEAVPDADVVITNPEHFSVALKYDVNGSGAPLVVAKGVDFIAMKIREVANANDVMMIEVPPLARAVYFTTDINEEIPSTLYLAVAQVLAYVFQLKAYRQGQGRKPNSLADIKVPQEAQYGVDGKPLFS